MHMCIIKKEMSEKLCRMSSNWWRSWSIHFNRGGLASSRRHLENITREQNLSNSEEYWFEREIIRSPCLILLLINCSDGASLCSSDWDWYVSVCIILFYFGFTIQNKDIFLSTYPGRLAQCLPLKTIMDLQISDHKKIGKRCEQSFQSMDLVSIFTVMLGDSLKPENMNSNLNKKTCCAKRTWRTDLKGLWKCVNDRWSLCRLMINFLLS